MIIRVQNNLDTLAPYTYLGSTQAAGVGTIGVQNINLFTANWAIQLGRTGEEQSEIKLISSGAPTGTSLVLTANTSFEHPQDTPIYAIKWDQIVFERSTGGTAGTATPMTNGTMTITPDASFTQFDDTSGATTYAYRTYFRNSVTTETSSESDWLTPAGFSFYSLANLRNRVRNRLLNSTYIPDDSVINDWLNEWLEVMNNAAVDVNKDYSLSSTTVAFAGTAELGTISATDFKEIRRVWLTDNGIDSYQATRMSLIDYGPNEVFNSTHPYFYYQGDNIIGRKPAETSGTATILYYKLPPVLVNDTDELPISMHGYTKSFIDYAESKALQRDNKSDVAGEREKVAYGERDRFIHEITPRAKTGPHYISVVESISGEDVDYSY